MKDQGVLHHYIQGSLTQGNLPPLLVPCIYKFEYTLTIVYSYYSYTPLYALVLHARFKQQQPASQPAHTSAEPRTFPDPLAKQSANNSRQYQKQSTASDRQRLPTQYTVMIHYP
jgi:hypothetical protein